VQSLLTANIIQIRMRWSYLQ